MKATAYFKPLPQQLTDDQRREWLRRQRTAENTLAIQVLGGAEPSRETIAEFQRYVCGEASLAQAIAQVREQMAQEHAAFRYYLKHRNII